MKILLVDDDISSVAALTNLLEHEHTLRIASNGIDAFELFKMDNYDVVIIVLEGKIETIDQQAEPYDVIFYSAGEPHGIYNSGTTSSRYLVFEFHTSNKMLISGIFNIFSYYFTRVTDRDRLKRKLRKILNLLHTRFKLF